MEVVLLYDRACPNVPAARANLMRAFSEARVTASWREELVDGAPVLARAFGSPTILVNGEDVANLGPAQAACCRTYPDGRGRLVGAPPVEMIAAALRRHEPAEPAVPAVVPARARSSAKTTLGVVPGVLLALLPKVACPGCWPAYAGVLGSLGLGFLLDTAWLLPLTLVALAAALLALGIRAPRRRGYGPLLVGAAASAALVTGKFVLEWDPMMWAGVAALVAASVWNAWPVRVGAPACAACPVKGEGT